MHKKITLYLALLLAAAVYSSQPLFIPLLPVRRVYEWERSRRLRPVMDKDGRIRWVSENGRIKSKRSVNKFNRR